ncbi:MAG: hypothetical protein LBC84_09205 [Prevotellaceae bacterium]|jgi:hypothetical protein|nr:hypothetical protein [Prevotellaceae bacterium]
MANKPGGGNRELKVGSKSFLSRRAEYWELMATTKYREGYFSDMSGGYYLEEKSSKATDIVEREAGMILADNGYIAIKKDEAGMDVTVDGYLHRYSFTYEQRTPYEGMKKNEMPKSGTPENIRRALSHAKEKVADFAIIYMKHNKHTVQSVKDGIRLFEAQDSYRFNQIIIITKDGRLHKHKH